MPDEESQFFEDLPKGLQKYSPPGLPDDQWIPLPLTTEEKKGGPTRERSAVTEQTSGPVDNEDLNKLMQAVGLLEVPFDGAPPEETPSILVRSLDDWGRVHLYLKMPIPGTSRERYYGSEFTASDEPRVAEVPVPADDWGFRIDDGARGPIEVVWAGGGEETVYEFGPDGDQFITREMPLPEGYAGGPLRANITFKLPTPIVPVPSTPTAIVFGLRARIVGPGQPADTTPYSPTLRTLFGIFNPSLVLDENLSTGVTLPISGLVTPADLSGAELQLQLSRIKSDVDDIYIHKIWVSGVKLIYDVFSFAPAA